MEGSHPKNHLALLADATGFGAQTTTLALVLLPVVLFLGIAAHGRLVEINREEVELSLAMNRLRHAYLKIAPALEPYFTTGHHDDERGLAASYLAGGLDPNSGQRQQCRRGRGDQQLADRSTSRHQAGETSGQTSHRGHPLQIIAVRSLSTNSRPALRAARQNVSTPCQIRHLTSHRTAIAPTQVPLDRDLITTLVPIVVARYQPS